MSSPPAPSLLAVSLCGWAVIGMNVVAVGYDALTQAYTAGGVSGAIVVLLLVVLWGLGQTDRWCDRTQREAEAKAALSELLLAKVRDGDEFNLRLAIPLADHGGTKH